MATDVDKRWLKRVILPAAASFIEGLGAGIAQTATTTVNATDGSTNTSSDELDTKEELGKAFEEAAGKVSEIVDEEAQVEILVKIKAGTPIGILFLEPVLEEDDVVVQKEESVVQNNAVPEFPEALKSNLAVQELLLNAE